MRRTIALVACVCLSGANGCSKSTESSDKKSKSAAASSSHAEKAAAKAAQGWLLVVDQGRYAQSWEQAASFFKTHVSKDQWQAQIQAARKPLGKVVTRTLLHTVYKTSLPGAPDGQYVVLQYRTRFENKQRAVETVTPMKDKGGSWRVSGYFIK